MGDLDVAAVACGFGHAIGNKASFLTVKRYNKTMILSLEFIKLLSVQIG